MKYLSVVCEIEIEIEAVKYNCSGPGRRAVSSQVAWVGGHATRASGKFGTLGTSAVFEAC